VYKQLAARYFSDSQCEFTYPRIPQILSRKRCIQCESYIWETVEAASRCLNGGLSFAEAIFPVFVGH